MDLKEFQKEVHQVAIDHGWWETERNIAEQIALMHSELSEALEEWRTGRDITSTYFAEVQDSSVDSGKKFLKPEGFSVELADCIIRILDTAESYGIDLSSVLIAKNEYNKTRSYKHGGKIA